jgi:hypothetical protein
MHWMIQPSVAGRKSSNADLSVPAHWRTLYHASTGVDPQRRSARIAYSPLKTGRPRSFRNHGAWLSSRRVAEATWLERSPRRQFADSLQIQ